LSRALVEIFSHDLLFKTMALRGGTALSKLYLKKFGRFSEDIDLVQIVPGDNGPFIDAIRSKLDNFLGVPKRKVGAGLTTLTYRIDAADRTPIKLKIETNTREHNAFMPFLKNHFSVNSDWFSGDCYINSYVIEELLGTKLRALYQRKKGRDLYDFWASAQELSLDYSLIVKSFQYYLKCEGIMITYTDLEENLKQKLIDKTFIEDMNKLLIPGVDYDGTHAMEWFKSTILPYLQAEKN
jgi:predicted nucleotidyltransferase component of viral defense system